MESEFRYFASDDPEGNIQLILDNYVAFMNPQCWFDLTALMFHPDGSPNLEGRMEIQDTLEVLTQRLEDLLR